MRFLVGSLGISLLIAASVSHAAGVPLDRSLVTPGLGARMDSLLERYSTYGYSGVALVERGGRLVLHHAYGHADRERGIPNQIGTRFAIASITKSFTAAALLELEGRSALRTRDSLGRYFPDLPPGTARITLEQLLTHASGLPADAEEQGLDTRTAAASLRRVSLRFTPGTDRLYSNFAYNVLARIIEGVTRRSFAGFSTDRVIARAGLRETALPLATGGGPAVARGYAGPVEALEATAPPPVDAHLGAASLVSTAGDLYRWLTALREGRVVTPSAWQTMIADTTSEPAFGWTCGRTGWGTRAITSGGDWDGYQADVYWFPDDSVTVTLTTNVRPNTFRWNAAVIRGVMRILRARGFAVPPPLARIDSAALAPYAGRYRFDSGATFDVSRRAGALFVGSTGQAAIDQLAWPGQAPPPAVETCNALADSFVAALAGGDTAFVSRTCEIPETARTVQAWWGERIVTAGGAARRRTVLGTGPKGPGKLESFVRIETERSEPVVVRLVWRLGSLRLTAIGSGIPLPATTLFLPEGEGRFAAYDPPTDQVVRIGFQCDGAGAIHGLSVLTAAGGRPVEARRER